jgi:hypothetical protein
MNVHYSSIDLRRKYFFYNYEITGGLGGFWLDFPVLGEVLSAGETKIFNQCIYYPDYLHWNSTFQCNFIVVHLNAAKPYCHMMSNIM